MTPESRTDLTTKDASRPLQVGALASSVALVLALLWIVLIYWQTAAQVAGIWWRSETFAHGLVVLPICAWLVWMRREHLVGITIKPTPWMVLPVALAGLAWLLGQLANVNALSHAALAFLLVGCAIGLLGLRAARELSFPLAFVFFGVPIGDFLLPIMMHYTAEFTVFALRASGIPVYQEGLFFVIPSGRWSVVEACSGLRYLIASFMVGTLFAYLNYNGWRKRWIFIGFAIAMPIVANWLRAYFIVMLGHHTDNRLAVGVDHLIYGWVFFGAIILLMFWVGSLWRDPVESFKPQTDQLLEQPLPLSSIAARALPVLLVTGLFPLILTRIDAPVTPFTLQVPPPSAAPGWVVEEQVFHDYLPAFGGYRGKVYRSYHHENGDEVGVFVAYYAGQRKGQELVTWDNRLTDSSLTSDDDWRQVSRNRVSSPVGEVLRTVVSSDSRAMAVWHWYWSDGYIMTSDEAAKIKLAVDRVTGRRDDAAFVAVMVPLSSIHEQSDAVVQRFLEAHRDELESMLQTVWDRK